MKKDGLTLTALVVMAFIGATIGWGCSKRKYDKPAETDSGPRFEVSWVVTSDGKYQRVGEWCCFERPRYGGMDEEITCHKRTSAKCCLLEEWCDTAGENCRPNPYYAKNCEAR